MSEVLFMRRSLYRLRLLGMAFVFLMSQAHATPQSRIALIIGNATYEHGPLRTPLNNATDLAAILPQLGFEVTVLYDADLRTMEDAIQTWSRRLWQGAVGLFYFAGRGVQIGGDTYLLPLRMRFEQEQDVREKALPVRQVLGSLAAARNHLSIVILDTSRNNPFLQQEQSMRQRLTVRDASPGTFIAYATAPGGAASEGQERNSIYRTHSE